jgi:hypothetical protein
MSGSGMKMECLTNRGSGFRGPEAAYFKDVTRHTKRGTNLEAGTQSSYVLVGYKNGGRILEEECLLRVKFCVFPVSGDGHFFLDTLKNNTTHILMWKWDLWHRQSSF